MRVIGRHYLQYCLDRRGQPIKTARTDLSNWAPILGDEPPIELTYSFTRNNYPASWISLNGEVLQSIQQIQRNEETALQRAKTIHAMAVRDSADSEKREQGKLLQPVGIRAASGDSWQLWDTETKIRVPSRCLTGDYDSKWHCSLPQYDEWHHS